MAGTRTRNDINLTAARTTHICGVAAGFHLKLLNRVWRCAEILCAEGGVRIGGAIEQKVVGVRPAAADAHRRALAGAPIKRIHVTSRSAVANVSSRNGEHQIDEHPSIE